MEKIGQTKGFYLGWLWDRIIICPVSAVPTSLGLGKEISGIVVYFFDMFVERVACCKDKLCRVERVAL
jgi:hypothetical protein